MKRKRTETDKATGPHKGGEDKSGSVFNWRDMEDIHQERRPGRAAAGPFSTLGPHPAPTRTPGRGPAASPETQTSGFRQDSTPKRGSEGVGKANRKKTTIARKHCTFFFFWLRVAQIPLQSCRHPVGAPGRPRAFHLCKVL